MGERRDGLRPGRDAAALVGDAVMSSLEDLVERLRRAAPPGEAPASRVPALRAPAPPAAVAEALGALVAAIVPSVLARIDPDALIDRVDIQRIVDRVDIDALAGRLDVNTLVGRLDVNALVRRIDLEAATREALQAVDVGEMVRDSTATIGSDLVEGLRSQAMRADGLLARGIDRVLRRDGPRRTAVGAGGAES